MADRVCLFSFLSFMEDNQIQFMIKKKNYDDGSMYVFVNESSNVYYIFDLLNQ